MTVVQWDPAFAQPPVALNEATPVDPVTAVLNAFRTHRLVALDEGDHNNLQGYSFRMALIHNPQFPGLVNDIVVESGNSLYQEVLDKSWQARTCLTILSAVFGKTRLSQVTFGTNQSTKSFIGQCGR
jgi:hypothetical protein